MKSKASLLLMEQLLMILVFSVAAALCLQVFAKARFLSEETVRRDQSVILARNAAELLKAAGGDTEAAENLGEDGYQVAVIPCPSRYPGLACAEIQVSYEDQVLFSLETGWQEALP